MLKPDVSVNRPMNKILLTMSSYLLDMTCFLSKWRSYVLMETRLILHRYEVRFVSVLMDWSRGWKYVELERASDFIYSRS